MVYIAANVYKYHIDRRTVNKKENKAKHRCLSSIHLHQLQYPPTYNQPYVSLSICLHFHFSTLYHHLTSSVHN